MKVLSQDDLEKGMLVTFFEVNLPKVETHNPLTLLAQKQDVYSSYKGFVLTVMSVDYPYAVLEITAEKTIRFPVDLRIVSLARVSQEYADALKQHSIFVSDNKNNFNRSPFNL